MTRKAGDYSNREESLAWYQSSCVARSMLENLRASVIIQTKANITNQGGHQQDHGFHLPCRYREYPSSGSVCTYQIYRLSSCLESSPRTPPAQAHGPSLAVFATAVSAHPRRCLVQSALASAKGEETHMSLRQPGHWLAAASTVLVLFYLGFWPSYLTDLLSPRLIGALGARKVWGTHFPRVLSRTSTLIQDLSILSRAF